MPLAAAGHSGVPSAVLVAVLLAAALHAMWNAIAHAVTDRLVGFALISVAAAVCGAAIVLAAPVPDRASWPFLAVSASLHGSYNLLLMYCYRNGDFGQAYPLARGTAPWLVALAAAVFANETLGRARLAGVLVVSVGLASLVLAGGRPTRAELPAIGAALLTGVVIAAYTTLDGLGVRRAGTTAGYAGWLFLGEGLVVPAVALAVRRARLWHDVRPHAAVGLTGGLLALAAYGLVLWGQTRGALAPIAALRETSVIIAAIIGAVIFHERFGRWRIVASVLVAGGVVLIDL